MHPRLFTPQKIFRPFRSRNLDPVSLPRKKNRGKFSLLFRMLLNYPLTEFSGVCSKIQRCCIRHSNRRPRSAEGASKTTRKRIFSFLVSVGGSSDGDNFWGGEQAGLHSCAGWSAWLCCVTWEWAGGEDVRRLCAFESGEAVVQVFADAAVLDGWQSDGHQGEVGGVSAV